MSNLPKCPECSSEYTYEDRDQYVCPECGHEWSQQAAEAEADEQLVTDANGNPLADGDSVTVIKDLKVKGTSSVVKVGTKVKNIRLVEGISESKDTELWCRPSNFSEHSRRQCPLLILSPREPFPRFSRRGRTPRL